MFRTSFIGNLGADPEKRSTAAGAELVQLNVAVNSRRRSADGEWSDRTDWCRVRCMGQLAKFSAQLGKGDRVFVAGRLELGEWTDREGRQRQSIDVWADDVTNLSPRRDQAEAPEAEADELEVDGATFQRTTAPAPAPTRAR